MSNEQLLSEQEFDELDRFLLSDRCSDEAMTMDALHGFLTCIALGPDAIRPDEWLPRVWGPEPEDRPKFRNPEQAKHIEQLIFRTLEDIKLTFEVAPNDFEPLFCEQLQDFGQLKRESDLPKENPKLAAGLTEFKQIQKEKILKRFQQMADQTGAEYAAPEEYRKVGSLVDDALVKEFDAKKLKVDKAYEAARNSGETKQVVDTTKLDEWLEANAGKSISVPEIKSIKADLDTLKKATNGQITIDDLEELYKSAGQLGKPGDPSGLFMKQVKGVINDMTEGAGGDLYRKARAQRAELGNQFENTYRVAKLLGTRGGYADRAIALDDVFSHVVLSGSLEEMRTVTKLLKKGGPQGQQAYAELQGQTIQYLKDRLTKNAKDELSFAKLKTAIDTLDREDKLVYMFGKQGRDTLMDVRNVIQDALVKPEGSVNYSNTGSVIARYFDGLTKSISPNFAKDFIKNRAVKKQVEESTKYDALADALKGKK